MTKPPQSPTELNETLVFPDVQAEHHWQLLPPAAKAIADPTAAARAAVEQPLDFPGIAQAVVPGDQVAIAADPNIPRLAEIVSGIVSALPLEDLAGVTVLLSEEASGSLLERLREALPASVVVKQHNGEDREGLAYLAANEAGDPLYLNRDLTFADLVLPVVLSRPAKSLDPSWECCGISPALADVASRRRYHYELLMRRAGKHEEATQVSWLLGCQMQVVVMPTADAQTAGIFAGTPLGVRDALALESTNATQTEPDSAIDLVLAYLDGDVQQQSWENVGRAVHVARSLVRPGGTIAIISDIDHPPSGSLLRLREVQTGDEDEIRKRLLKDTDRFALPAALLLDATREGRVILYSRLPAETVEQLGLGALSTPTELERLVEEHAHCGIVHAAQFCGAS